MESVRKVGLDQAISAALAPWRKPRVVHDPGKVLLDIALTVALDGDCLADIARLRAEAAVFGPVASDPTVSRLIDTLAASDEKAPDAVRRARSEVRSRVWSLVGGHAPDTGGEVTIDMDGVLVVAHSDKQDAAPTWKKTYGHHPLMGFVDHGPATAWTPVIETDGGVRDGAWVAELADGRPKGMRLIVRKERPHPGAQLRITDADGMRIDDQVVGASGEGHVCVDAEPSYRPITKT